MVCFFFSLNVIWPKTCIKTSTSSNLPRHLLGLSKHLAAQSSFNAFLKAERNYQFNKKIIQLFRVPGRP